MSDGIWTIGLTDFGDGSSASVPYPSKDNFLRYTTSAPFGTAGIVVSPTSSRLYRGVFVNASTTNAYWVQVHNRNTVPTNGFAPVWQVRLPILSNSGGSVDLDLSGVNGLPLQIGMVIALSSTPGTLTLATANDMAFLSIIYTARKV